MSGVLFAMQEAFSSDNKTKEEKGDAAPDSASHDGTRFAFAAEGCASIIHRLAFPRSAIVPETVEVEGETYYRLRLTLLSVVENRKLSKRVECAK